jgi:hypothetical protein
VWLQTALFGCAVLWFGIVSPDPTARLRAGRLAGLHHALMAAAMIWMVIAMPAAMHMGPKPGGQTISSMSHPAIPAVVPAVSVLLAAYFALAVVPWLTGAIGSGRPASNKYAVGHAAMSVGMAAMLLVMH